MGAALCSCGGRGEELAGARGRLGLGLGAGSPAGVTALALDRHWHARNGKAVPLALAAKFSSLVPPGHSLPLPLAGHGGTPNGADPHGSLLASRGETYALSDDFLHEEDEQQRRAMLASRQTAAQALADAFRAKLQEPPMSPRSKFALLSTKLGEEDEEDEEEDQEDDAVTNEDDKEEAADTDKTVATSDEEETPEGGARRRRRPRRSADENGGLVAARRKPWSGHAYYASSFAAAYALSEGDDASLTEEDWKARANPLVTVIVPPGPCGLVLQVNQDARGAPPTVDGFVRTYDGLKGTIENSALVRKGSVLVAINDIDVSRMPLKEVIRTLNLSSHLERQFAFRNPPADTSAL